MSVRENLELGAYGSKTHGVELEERAARVYRLFPRLKERFAQMVREAGFGRVCYRNLTGGVAAIHSGWKL